MRAEFYFEIQYFNFDWKIAITLLRCHRNTQPWQVTVKHSTVTSQTQISNVLQLWNASAKCWPPCVCGRFFAAAVTMSLQKCLMLLGTVRTVVVVLNFSEFLNYLKIHEFYLISNFQVLNSQSMTSTTNYLTSIISTLSVQWSICTMDSSGLGACRPQNTTLTCSRPTTQQVR